MAEVLANTIRAGEVRTVQADSDSMERCIAELVNRFAGRGILRSVQTEANSQARAVKRARLIAPNAYASYGVQSAADDRYRTGVYNGERYMTSDDFVRYYRVRRKNVRYDTDLASMAVVRNRNVAVPQPRAKEPLLRPAGEEDRQRVKKLVSMIPEPVRKKHPAIGERMAEVHKWLNADEIRTSGEKRRFPVSVASAILVTAISFSMIVGGTVLYSEANATYREATESLASLKAEERDLEQKLAVKNDLSEIEDYARNTLGMVDREYVQSQYLCAGEEDEHIEVYEEENPSFGLSTLLSALGFR